MNKETMLEIICAGLKSSIKKTGKKQAVSDWYDEKIKALRNNGLNDVADRWEKLKEASLKKCDED